jgi:hypothetical protein
MATPSSNRPTLIGKKPLFRLLPNQALLLLRPKLGLDESALMTVLIV